MILSLKTYKNKKMPNNNWGINFPDNPYEGQIFYYPHTQDTFTYVVPKNQSGTGQWVMVTYQDFTSNRN